jgi:hypothetical protein
MNIILKVILAVTRCYFLVPVFCYKFDRAEYLLVSFSHSATEWRKGYFASNVTLAHFGPKKERADTPWVSTPFPRKV